jgi:hypothetical protein
MSHRALGRIGRACGRKPQRRETFPLSRDPLRVEKIRDLVGLSRSPPENGRVLCVDEKPRFRRSSARSRCF